MSDEQSFGTVCAPIPCPDCGEIQSPPIAPCVECGWEQKRETNRPLFDDRDRATFQAAVAAWGLETQIDIAEEEAAEFVVASKHYDRGKIELDDLIDELADMRIVSEQLAMFLGREAVYDRVEEKMDRLRDRLPHEIDDVDGEWEE